jgi:hypothetical protein
MPRDLPAASTPLPAWLDPALLRALADGIAADFAAGARQGSAIRAAMSRAQAFQPSLPAPYLVEAVELAAWLAAPCRGP